MTGPLKIATYTCTVEPAEGNAQGELPLTTLVQHILETATFHAESWSVGYSTLIQENHAWVLARLAVEMERYPRIGDTFVVSTWIESYNKYFSARNFEFADTAGRIYGYARSVWSMIDMQTRTSVDLTTFDHLAGRVAGKECPIAPQSKLKPVAGEPLFTWPVRCSDIDLNRHVNSVKYIEHMLDSFPLQQYDDNAVKRFEINYISETRYGAVFHIFRDETAPGVYALDIRTGEGETVCRGKICFEPRK
ncbi:MAG: acyl-[acyl-carrier-protein] thioesterase [Coprobacter sp.]|nr:acyl-[acyl-carrier-protein] thioesterase [Coprobacter sp.]